MNVSMVLLKIFCHPGARTGAGRLHLPGHLVSLRPTEEPWRSVERPCSPDQSHGKNHLYYSNSNSTLGPGPVLQYHSETQPSLGNVAERAGETLKIMHRWGYSPTIDALAKDLLGGSVTSGDLKGALESRSQIQVWNGFASLSGYEHLVQRSSERVKSHRVLNGDAWSIARMFATDLASVCPFVKCAAVCGSLASRGDAKSDDLAFDLFVKSGTKYVPDLHSA